MTLVTPAVTLGVTLAVTLAVMRALTVTGSRQLFSTGSDSRSVEPCVMTSSKAFFPSCSHRAQQRVKSPAGSPPRKMKVSQGHKIKVQQGRRWRRDARAAHLFHPITPHRQLREILDNRKRPKAGDEAKPPRGEVQQRKHCMVQTGARHRGIMRGPR